jgi:hypothetical protein
MIFFPRKKLSSVVLAALSLLIILSGCQKSNGPPTDSNPTGNPAVPIPQIFEFIPSKGLPNTVIKIRGLDFNTKIAENIAYVGGDQLKIVSITNTEMVAVLPANANVGAGTLAIYSDGKSVAAAGKFNVLRGVQSAFFKPALDKVQYVGVDDFGNTYGYNGSNIYKTATNGSTIPMTAINNDFKLIAGFAITLSGDIYIANKGNFNIVKLTPQKVTTVFSGTGVQGHEDGPATTAKFTGPAGIAYFLGSFYVIDGHRVRKISIAGTVTTLAGSGVDGNIDGVGVNAQFGTLEGIAVDADGTVYVTDSKYRNIRRITADGKVVTIAGSGEAGFKDGIASIAQFTKPRGIAVDPAGNLFVTDENSTLPYYAIRMVNQVGDVSTFIKGIANADVANGAISSSTTYSPLGLCFDAAGNLYIVNTGAAVISKVSFTL